MKSSDQRNLATAIVTGAALIFLVGCNGGGGGSTSSPITTPSGNPTSTPSSTPTPKTTDNPCADLNSCTINSDGSFQFPDGQGGSIVCKNGACSDGTLYSAGYTAGESATAATAYNQGYSDGYASGQTSGYSSGYAQGKTDGVNSGYTAGYNAGTTDGYNSGYSDGYNAGYSDGYSTGYNTGYNDGYSDGYNDGSSGNSVGGKTKDVDLQKAQVQQKDAKVRAQEISDQFGMSYESAVQLTELADRVQKMTVAGKMTASDRSAVTQSALGIAGLTPDDVNNAISEMGKGNDKATDQLLEKAAQNLGMSSSTSLRDKRLPALGVDLNN